MPRALTVLVVLLSPTTFVLMALAYCLLFHRTMNHLVFLAIFVLILLEMAAHTLWGSRSAIVGFVQHFMIVALAILGSIRLRRSHVAVGVLMLPALIAVLVAAFAISTYNRTVKEAGNNALDVGNAIKTASESSAELSDLSSLEPLAGPIFGRAGFFDFSAEVIAHRDEYRSVLNLSTYAKSVLDNVLTPGMDFFDQPRTGNALLFVYRDWGQPSKRDVIEFYHSDQIGIYGEVYALFGWGGLAFLFGIGFLFKQVYVRATGRNPLTLALKRIVVLMMFAEVLDSFGLDWTVSEFVPLAATMYLYTFFFSVRRDTAVSRPVLVDAPHAQLPAQPSSR